MYCRPFIFFYFLFLNVVLCAQGASAGGGLFCDGEVAGLALVKNCNEGFSGVFTDVSVYKDFIDRFLKVRVRGDDFKKTNKTNSAKKIPVPRIFVAQVMFTVLFF